jgi:hypothetical protein
MLKSAVYTPLAVKVLVLSSSDLLLRESVPGCWYSQPAILFPRMLRIRPYKRHGRTIPYLETSPSRSCWPVLRQSTVILDLGGRSSQDGGQALKGIAEVPNQRKIVRMVDGLSLGAPDVSKDPDTV